LHERASDEGVKEVDVTIQTLSIHEGNTVLSEGHHGVHIHEVGDCTASCAAAGGHFDPGPNGNPSPDGNHPFHLGDLVNIEIGSNGRGSMRTTTSRVTLSPGPLSVFDANGSAFIIHVGADTYCPNGQVTGCAGGARAACGIIEQMNSCSGDVTSPTMASGCDAIGVIRYLGRSGEAHGAGQEQGSPASPARDPAQRSTPRHLSLVRIADLRPDGKPNRRRNWHPECVETYKLCWPSHARQWLKERDSGICAGCSRNTVTKRLRRSRPITPRPDDARYAGTYCRAVWTERHAWELDHIVPLADGGTHELANMQTLCRPCHRTKTAREATRRAQRRQWPNASAVAERAATAPTEML